MNNSKTSVQRKQGVGMFKPVSWNRGRRLTSIGLGEGERAASLGSMASTASMGQILNIEVRSTVRCKDATQKYLEANCKIESYI